MRKTNEAIKVGDLNRKMCHTVSRGRIGEEWINMEIKLIVGVKEEFIFLRRDSEVVREMNGEKEY